MRLIVHEIINCPLEGTVKQMYLQGKVFELMALQIGEMVPHDRSSLKPETVRQIYYAAEILRSQLEHPPDQTSLAQLVGVSDRTLRRGFRAVFGTTIWDYLTTQRLQRAEQLLSAGGLSIAQVGSQIGYTNQGHFGAAFKRKFGITPRQYLEGHKSI